MNFPIIKKTNKLERIFILAALLILGLIIGSLLGVVYPLVTGQDVMSLNSLRFMQISSQIFTFVLPPILYAMLIKDNPRESLGIRKVSYHWFIIGFIMMYAILPLNNVFAEWNAGLKLPESMSRIEELIKEMYESSAVILEKLVNVNTFGGFVINLIMIAGLAAIGEELLFRSIIQTSLIKFCKNAHVGIIIASAIFSFIHFDFYAFIPRLVLGMLLGYMFYFSRSIWVSMFMHFVNNATAVVIYYLNNIGITNIDVETFGQTQLLPLLISIALMFVLFWLAIRRTMNDERRTMNNE